MGLFYAKFEHLTRGSTLRRIRHGWGTSWEGEAGRCGRGFTGQLRFGGADRVRLSPRDSERDLPLPPSYRGGQLVVEYATVCFRSQEDFGPVGRGSR